MRRMSCSKEAAEMPLRIPCLTLLCWSDALDDLNVDRPRPVAIRPDHDSRRGRLKIDVGQLQDMTTLRAFVRAVPLFHYGHVRSLGFHCVARFGLHLLRPQIELLDLRCGCKEFLGTRKQCLRYLTSDMSVPPVFVRKGI